MRVVGSGVGGAGVGVGVGGASVPLGEVDAAVEAELVEVLPLFMGAGVGGEALVVELLLPESLLKPVPLLESSGAVVG